MQACSTTWPLSLARSLCASPETDLCNNAQWINQTDDGPAAAWRTGIFPLLEKVWPRERELCDVKSTCHLVALAVRAGDASPEALEYLLPYFRTLETFHSDAHMVTNAIGNSPVPQKFPQETLTLLWHLFGKESDSDLLGIPKILDRLIAACPDIESDRRLQSLNQRAVRYD